MWDISKGKVLKRFSWEPDQYRIKSCRFVAYRLLYIFFSSCNLWLCSYTPKEDTDGNYWLYSCCVPIKVAKNSTKTSYVLKWCTTSWKVHKKSSALKQLACVMNVK